MALFTSAFTSASCNYTTLMISPHLWGIAEPIAHSWNSLIDSPGKVAIQYANGLWQSLTKEEVENRIERLKAQGSSFIVEQDALDSMIW